MKPLPFTITSEAVNWIRKQISEIQDGALHPWLFLISSLQEYDRDGKLIGSSDRDHIRVGFDKLHAIKKYNLVELTIDDLIIYIDDATLAYCVDKSVRVVTIQISQSESTEALIAE